MMRNKHKKWMAFLPLLIIAAVFLFGWLVMFLWNYALVPATGFNLINFWQAIGILVLSKILFSGFGGKNKGGGAGWKNNKWSTLSDEEKARFKQEWWKRCGHYPEAKETNVETKNETDQPQ